MVTVVGRGVMAVELSDAAGLVGRSIRLPWDVVGVDKHLGTKVTVVVHAYAPNAIAGPVYIVYERRRHLVSPWSGSHSGVWWPAIGRCDALTYL